jgi:hypothetical protein
MERLQDGIAPQHVVGVLVGVVGEDAVHPHPGHLQKRVRDVAGVPPVGQGVGELLTLAGPQTAIPAIAKDARRIALIEEAIKRIPTCHDLHLGDARAMQLPPESVHLVVTSPQPL